MGKMKRWTEAEKEFLIREYKNLGGQEIARVLERTLNSVYQQYSKLKYETGGNAETDYVTECPQCGSKKINVVSSVVRMRCIEVYYCMNCLHEFTKGGKIIEPLWEGKGGYND